MTQVKNAPCSCRASGLSSQRQHEVGHNHLQLQTRGSDTSGSRPRAATLPACLRTPSPTDTDTQTDAHRV